MLTTPTSRRHGWARLSWITPAATMGLWLIAAYLVAEQCWQAMADTNPLLSSGPEPAQQKLVWEQLINPGNETAEGVQAAYDAFIQSFINGTSPWPDATNHNITTSTEALQTYFASMGDFLRRLIKNGSTILLLGQGLTALMLFAPLIADAVLRNAHPTRTPPRYVAALTHSVFLTAIILLSALAILTRSLPDGAEPVTSLDDIARKSDIDIPQRLLDAETPDHITKLNLAAAFPLKSDQQLSDALETLCTLNDTPYTTSCLWFAALGDALATVFETVKPDYETLKWAMFACIASGYPTGLMALMLCKVIADRLFPDNP